MTKRKTTKKDLFENVSVKTKKQKISTTPTRKYDSVLEQAKKVGLSKNQYIEYNKIKSNFNISIKEYKSLYRYIRNANKKHEELNALEEKGEVFINPKFSTDLSRIKSKEMYEKRIKFVKKFLKKDSIKVFNREVRNNLYETLQNYFGDDAQVLIEKFESMTDNEYYQFFAENKELERLGYDSNSYELLNYLDQNLKQFKTALNITDIGE